MDWIELSKREPEGHMTACVVLVDREIEGPVYWTADKGFVYPENAGQQHELGWDCSHWRPMQRGLPE